MSNDPNIDATDPEALMAGIDPVNNAIIAARLGDPPGGMVAGMSPDGIASANTVCTPAQSVLGMQFSEELGTPAALPAFKTAFAATIPAATEPAPGIAPAFNMDIPS